MFRAKLGLAILVSFLFLGCLQERKTTPSVSKSSWYEGILSVKNLGGYPASIKVSWHPASRSVSGYRVYSLLYDDKSETSEWVVIGDIAPEVTSFIHSDLISGQIYSYMVRAVEESSKTEDENSNQKATVAFEGIGSAKTTGKTTARITLNSAVGSFDEVRIYAEPRQRGSRKTLVATAKGAVDTIDVTGLRSGVTYKFSAQAYMSYLSAEDGNEIYIQAQTDSDSFGTGAALDVSYRYQGVMAAQAFGLSPGAPDGTPKDRLVKLTWPEFNLANSSTKYRVIRTATSSTPTSITSTLCTPTTLTSCIVDCAPTGSGPKTCEDGDVGAPPLAYYYVIALEKTDFATSETWVEELPITNPGNFYVKVSIPPDNMVLIQRDAANYEMCRKIGSTSDPKKRQRCAYSGIAANPQNTGPGRPYLNLETGYYDFGYNLFVDRYRLACNWTKDSTTCGPQGCVGTPNLTSSVPPDPSLGALTDVYLAMQPGQAAANCFYRRPSGWIPIDGITDPNEIRAATTIDPMAGGSRHNPNLVVPMGPTAFRLCSAQSSEYGTKRLMRRREHVHAAALATLPGEPGAITDPVAEMDLRTGFFRDSTGEGGQLPGFQRCARYTTPNSTHLLPAPASFADFVAATNTRAQIFTTQGYNQNSLSYFIGTTSTANCVSRWGSQDPVFNGEVGNAVLSDSFSNSAGWGTYTPIASDYDSGVLADWGSYIFDGNIGLKIGLSGGGAYTMSLNPANLTGYSRYIAPMGLVLKTDNPIYTPLSTVHFNGSLGPNAFNGAPNASVLHNFVTPLNTFYMAEGYYHRFSYKLQTAVSTLYSNSVWCAVEAE